MMKSCRVVSGGKGEGKTTYLLSHFTSSPGIVTIHRGEEYFLRYLESGEEELLLTRRPIFPSLWHGWHVNEEAYGRGNRYLLSIEEGIVVLDEVGMMEVEERGFFPFLSALGKRNIDLVAAVRKDFVTLVGNKFFPSYSTITLSQDR